jgi:stage III sporulation protein AA
VTSDLIDSCIDSLCDGSVYAHFHTIKDGYISVGKGVRAGICGRAYVENGEICGVSDITSINIRIPQHIYNASTYLYNILKETGFFSSVIIYSAPGVGKTTILRDLIYKLSNTYPPIRYAIIDSRDEIIASIEKKINADVFVSYPKGTAIELATKSMTPQLIICDEIASLDEANEVLRSVNSGVKLIATAHASTFDELVSKNTLQSLFKNNVFDFALGVSREYGEKRYKFSLTRLK